MAVYDIKPADLIKRTAVELKAIIAEPEWTKFVKTGVHKERPPVDKDWYFTRAASVLRKIYFRGPIGVNKLRVQYGGKKNRGYKPEHFYPGSGKIIRTILQQLEKEELIKQAQKGSHKGRIVTPKGKSLLDKLSKVKAKKDAGVTSKNMLEGQKTESKGIKAEGFISPAVQGDA